MGEKDSIFKEYASDNERFANLINFFVYYGKQVIMPDQLRPGNIEQIVWFYENTDNSSKSAQKSGAKKSKLDQFLTRFRDLFKFAVFKQDDNTGYLFLGLEEQTDISLFMPVRMMLYDAMAYSAQTEGNLKIEYPEIAEMPASRLIPVISLIVYFGHKKWTAARSLYDMMPNLPDGLKAVIPNFWINLIEPLNMKEDDYKRMSTNWSAVFEAFKQYVDKGPGAYYNYLRTNPRMTNVEKADIQIIETMTECRMPIDKTKGDKNMNVNKMMEDYFKEHDEEVIANAKLRIIEDATPKIIEEAAPKIIEEAAPKIIENYSFKIARRMLEHRYNDNDIMSMTLLSSEQLDALKREISNERQ